MTVSETRRALKGSSVANRRRAAKGWATRREKAAALHGAITSIGSALLAYESFEKEVYGGRVERTVLRQPEAGLGEPAEIDEYDARYECSGTAFVIETKGTEFEGFEGKQLRYLLTLDNMFMFPSFRSAFAEVLDAGCAIRTKMAVYRIADRKVLNGMEKADG